MFKKHLFLYGSLLGNIKEEKVEKMFKDNCHFITKGFILGKLYDLGEYPGAIPTTNKDDKVFGKIFWVKHPRRTFRILDEYEEYFPKNPKKSLFIRCKTKAYLLPSENNIKCWTYFYNQKIDKEPQINSGNYLKNSMVGKNNL